MSIIRIKEIAFNSSDYKKAVTIREEILRIPLGLSFSKEELEREASDIHIAGFSDETMIGTLFLSPQNGFIVTQWGHWRCNRETLECLVLQWIQDGLQERSTFPPRASGPFTKWRYILNRLKRQTLIDQSGDQLVLTPAGQEKLTAKLAEFSCME